MERLYQDRTETGSTWFIESTDTEGKRVKEEFDHVCVANGHYSDSWIPDIPGLSYVLCISLHRDTNVLIRVEASKAR